MKPKTAEENCSEIRLNIEIVFLFIVPTHHDAGFKQSTLRKVANWT